MLQVRRRVCTVPIRRKLDREGSSEYLSLVRGVHDAGKSRGSCFCHNTEDKCPPFPLVSIIRDETTRKIIITTLS